MRLKLWKMNPISRLRTRAPPGEIEMLHRFAAQLIAAAGGRIEQAENREQRGFAAAGRPGNGDGYSTVADCKIHLEQGVGLDFVPVRNTFSMFCN